MTQRPSWSRRDVERLGVRTDIPTAADVLGVGANRLRRLLRESPDGVVQVQVGRRVVEVTTYRLGRQRWIVVDSLLKTFEDSPLGSRLVQGGTTEEPVPPRSGSSVPVLNHTPAKGEVRGNHSIRTGGA